MTTDSGRGIGPKSLFAASSVQVPVKFGWPWAAVRQRESKQDGGRRQKQTSLHERSFGYFLPTIAQS